MTITQINHKSVGNGRWSLTSAKRYCEKKGIALTSLAYRIYSLEYGFDYEYIDITSGEIKASYNSDPARSMLGI